MTYTTAHLSRVLRAVLASLSLTAGLVLLAPSGVSANSGAIQVTGEAVPWPATPVTCDPLATGPIDYVLAMPEGSGSLSGCLYGNRLSERFNSGGQLQVNATETFVGCFAERCGSFQLEAVITNRWDGLPGVGNQINGRCQHKVVSESGTGDFVGVEGRLDFKDILETDIDGTVTRLTFDYKGHLRFT